METVICLAPATGLTLDRSTAAGTRHIHLPVDTEMLTSLLIALVEAVGDLGLQDGDSPFDRGSHRPVQAQQVILGHGGTAAVRVEAASQRISSEYAFPTPAMNFWLVRVS